MATLTNVNPKNPNNKDEEKTLGSQNSSTITPTSSLGPTAAGGVQQGTSSSGRFANLNQYMNANKQAGSKLGQVVGQNVNQQVGKATTSATTAQQGFQGGLATGQQELGKINEFNTKLGDKTAPRQEYTTTGFTTDQDRINLENRKKQLNSWLQQNPGKTERDYFQLARDNSISGTTTALQSQSATPVAAKPTTLSTQTGSGTVASDYNANLGNRADYAQTLANDPEALANFIKYNSGQVASDQNKAIQGQANTAQTATTQAEKTFDEKQKELAQANKRGTLLSDVARTRNYGGGLSSLDNAFLQTDKNNTLGNLRTDLQKQQQQFSTNSLLPKLTEQFGTLKTNFADDTKKLQDTTNNLTTDLNTDVDSRKDVMTDARTKGLANFENEFDALQKGEAISPEFAKAMGLTEGQRIYNVFGDEKTMPGIGNAMDVSSMQANPMNRSDLTNQKDVDLYSAFAKLAQTNPAITEASKLNYNATVKPDVATNMASAADAARASGSLYSASSPSVYGATEAWADPGFVAKQMERLGITAPTSYDEYVKQLGANPASQLDPFSGLSAGLHTDINNDILGGTLRAHGTQGQTGVWANINNANNQRSQELDSVNRDAYNQILADLQKKGFFNTAKIKKG